MYEALYTEYLIYTSNLLLEGYITVTGGRFLVLSWEGIQEQTQKQPLSTKNLFDE